MAKENKQPIDIKAKMQAIHYDFLGNRSENAVKLIDEFGIVDFWGYYYQYLHSFYELVDSRYHYFVNAVTIYHKVKNPEN